MVKVSVFCSSSPSALQDTINRWLRDQQAGHDIYIINTNQSESDYYLSTTGFVREITYTIIYKED